MTTHIISGCSPDGYRDYASACVATWATYWPPEIEIAVYVEENNLWPARIKQRTLDVCPGQVEFIEKNKTWPQANGREANELWSKRARADLARGGYCYRYDAVRFSRQLFIPEHAVSQAQDGDVVAWFDADVLAFDHIPSGFVERLMGNSDVVSLGRDGQSTELGFWAVKVNTQGRDFVHKLAETCRSGSIFHMQEWHSGYVFDRVMETSVRSGLNHKNLTHHRQGHVWFKCDLGRYTDHLKGERRKKLGYSPERWAGVEKNMQAALEAQHSKEQERA